MATDSDLGIDVNMFVDGSGAPDLDPYFGEISGPRAVAQAVALRCYTPRADAPGFLLGAENDGIFLPDFMQAKLTDQTLFTVRTLVAGEARKDERVETAKVSVTADLATQRMLVDISGTTAEGPFDLTLAISDVTVELLESNT